MRREVKLFDEINKKYTKPGALLRGVRIRECLTQKQLAKKLHVTQSYVSQIELGKRNISKDVADRAAKLFDFILECE